LENEQPLPVSAAAVKGSSSFLKKRTKKPLLMPPPHGAFCIIRARHQGQKFLLLFSKRSAFFPRPLSE
jgi:hypothetical protein